jgi:hypothetical protein
LIKSFIENLPDAILNILEAVIVPFAISYQRYIAGHALYGDPNSLNSERSLRWEASKDDGNTIENALKAGFTSKYGNSFFTVGPDRENEATACDFWSDVAQEIGSLYVGAGNTADHTVDHVKPLNLQVQDLRKDTWAM